VTPIDPRELLAAYATGDVSEDERRAVDAYLEQSAEARAELEEVRATVARIAAAEPRPSREPDWERLTADIMTPLAAGPVKRPFWRPNAVRMAAAAALAAAVIALVWLRREAPAPTVARTPEGEIETTLMPDHSWLEPAPAQLAQVSDDDMTEDWLEETPTNDDNDPLELDELDLEELRAVDRALASL